MPRPNQRVELHCHSYFSLLDGLPSPKQIVDDAVKKNMKAVAITDHGNVSAMIKLFKHAKKNNIKPIYGIELYETDDTSVKNKDSKYYHLLVLAKNNNGMRQLNKIIKKSTMEDNFYYKPRIQTDWLTPFADDIIISTACLAGRINKLDNLDEKTSFVNSMKSKFKHFYIELQSHTSEEQIKANKELLEIAQITNTPIVITCDAHYLNKEDEGIHSSFKATVTKSKQSPDEIGEIYKDCYVQTVDEIYEKMNYLPEQIIQEGINNSIEIADMCNVSIEFGKVKFPQIQLPDSFKNNTRAYLEYRVEQGWQDRNYSSQPLSKQEEMKQRLAYELDVIEDKGFCDYFAIVDDFIAYNNKCGFMPPQGRGSAAGSAVAYFMKFHDLDPLDYDLIFERFLNPDPNDTHIPDIDVDFVHTARSKIVDYCSDKYGEDKVCNIGLFSYILAKTAIKDIGKSLGIPFNVTNEICKNISDKENLKDYVLNKKHKKFIDKYPNFDIDRMFVIASEIQGIPKSFGSHPSGKIICNEVIEESIGVAVIDGENVCMCDMHDVEDIGFIKFDFLGLKTNTIIQNTLSLIGKTPEIIETDKMNMNDDKVYEQFRKGNTSGIFQFSSYGMREVLAKMEVDCLEDLIAANALFRPGAMNYIDTFCHNKKYPKDIKYVHEDLKEILGVTYGQLIYQEQMMAIGKLANVPSVDDLRRACGKKIVELMDKQEVYLKDGLMARGWSQEQAETMWEQIKLFAEYSFNKSHAASYAKIAYVTMWLKVYYPVEFMTALLNVYGDDGEKISQYITEAQRMGIVVKPPNINLSKKEFTIQNNAIVFGLKYIKNCGDSVASIILKERENGKFVSFTDFLNRVNPDKTTAISMIKAGAFGQKNKENILIKYMESLFKKKEYKPVTTIPKLEELKTKWGIVADTKEERIRLFNEKKAILFNEEQERKYEKHKQDFQKKYMQQPEMWEYEVLSMFITNNPLLKYLDKLTSFEDVKNGKEVTVVGVITTVQKKTDKNKKQFAFFEIYQNEIMIEIICWHTQYKLYSELIKKGNPVVVYGKKDGEKIVLSEMKRLKL